MMCLIQATLGETADAFARLDASGAEPEVIALCKRCLAFEPADRPTDGNAVANEVATLRAAAEERAKQAELAQVRAEVQAAEQRKRRRLLLRAGGSVVMVLLVGLAVSLWQMNRAIAAERLAQANEAKALAERDAKDVALQAEQKARAESADRLAQIELINNSVFDIFTDFDIRKLKAGPDPLEYVLTDRLIAAGRKLDEKAIRDPLVLANLRDRLGLTLLSLGRAKEAIEFISWARETRQTRLGPDHPDTLTSMNHLAEGYRAAGKLDQALPLYEETLRLQKATLGANHRETLVSMNNLALGYKAAGKLDLALPLYEETLRLQRAKLGPDHFDTLTSMNNLAEGYRAAGKLDQALPLYEETLRLMKTKLGPDHPDTLTSMGNLALGYQAAGKLDQTIPLYEETLRLRKIKLGPDHPDTLTSLNSLAGGYWAAGKLDLALPLFDETLRLTKAKLGPDHPNTLTSMNNLAGAYQSAGKLDQALPLYEETLRLMKAKLGPDHPDTLNTTKNLAIAFESAGKLDQALPLYEETLRLMKAKLGPDHPDTLTSMYNLGAAYCAAKQDEKAAPLLKMFVAGQRKRFPKDDRRFAGLLVQVASDLLKCHQFVTAEELLRESLAIREKKEPEAWTTFNAMSMLGGALLGQKKYADAEPLLLKGYEGIRARLPQSPGANAPRLAMKQRLAQALDRLIELYTAWEKPEEVKKYQAEKAKLAPSPPPPGPKPSRLTGRA